MIRVIHILQCVSLIFLCALFLALQPSQLDAQQPPKIIYIYDDLGRLAKVVDNTTGECAIYNYDAVGNILSIARQSNCLGVLVVDSIVPGSQPGSFIATGQNLLGATVTTDIPGVFVTDVTSSDTQVNFRFSGGGQFCSLTGNVTIANSMGSATRPITISSATVLVTDVGITDAIGVLGEKDQYCFTLATTEHVVLQVIPTAGSLITPCVEIFTGTPAQAVTGGRACTATVFPGTPVRLDVNLAAGTYFVEVSDNGTDQTGGYNVLLERVGAQGAVALASDVPVADTISPVGDIDLYTFTLGTAELVILQVIPTAGSMITPCVEVFTGTPAQPVTGGKACAATVFPGTPVRLDVNLTAGTYFVTVSDNGTDQSGGYNVLLEQVGAQGAVALVVDVPVPDTISPVGDMDLYTFTLGTTDHVVLQVIPTAGSMITPCMEVFTGTPAQAVAGGKACAATVFPGTPVQLNLDLPAETYFVLVSDNGTNQSGNYDVLFHRGL